MTYVPGIPYSLSFSNSVFFQNSTTEHPRKRAFSHLCPACFPVLASRSRDDEPVSPTQTTLLKLLDSYLNSVPTPFFRDRDDHRDKLAGFLASVFLLQARYTRHAIQQATGELSPGQNAATEVREGGETAIRADGCALDGRLPGVWVALVLLSTSLSSILLAEQEDHGGASTDPEVVTLTHLCHDTISAARSRTGAGFVEELLGMIVPWFRVHATSCRQTFTPRNARFAPRFSPTYQFWEGQGIPERQGGYTSPKRGRCRLSLPQTRPGKTTRDPLP